MGEVDKTNLLSDTLIHSGKHLGRAADHTPILPVLRHNLQHIRRQLIITGHEPVLDFIDTDNDTLLSVVLIFDVVYYSGTVGAFWMDVLFWILTALALLYLIMRPYIYMMLITFDMKVRKMFKNALIFSLLGFKRNIMAFLGLLILVLFMLLLIFGIGGALLPIGIAIPLVILFSGASFMADFAAWYKIHDIMIAPAEDGE